MSDASSQTVSCPGCGHPVHDRCQRCGHCGYRSVVAERRDLLESLSVVSSILLGLAVASLVELRQALDSDQTTALVVTAGCWFLSSALLALVLFGSEFARRGELSRKGISPTLAEEEDIDRYCSQLFGLFLTTLVLLAAGMLALAFSLSNTYGWWASAMLLVVAVIGTPYFVFFRKRAL